MPGRDGQRADCLLLYSRGDAMVHRHFINQGTECERAGREARLQALMRFAEARDCRRKPLLAYFGETLGQPCGHCDNCVQTVKGDLTDATAAAQKFLSCVKLTGQSFGPAHIIAVLRGSRAEKVLARRHDRLSVFGIGKEHSTEEWGALAQQFIRLGLLEQDFEFGSLRLTPKGWDVLRGKEKVLVPRERALLTPSAPAASERHTRSASFVLSRRAASRRLAGFSLRVKASSRSRSIMTSCRRRLFRISTVSMKPVEFSTRRACSRLPFTRAGARPGFERLRATRASTPGAGLRGPVRGGSLPRVAPPAVACVVPRPSMSQRRKSAARILGRE